MTDSVGPYSPPPHSSQKKSPLLFLVIAAVIAAVLGGFIIIRQQKQTPKEPEETVVEQEAESTPTEAPEIDKTEVKIQVLNGTGTPGQAKLAVDALVEAGFDADNIEADNAEEYEDTVTKISAKEGYDQIIDEIKSALENSFDDISIDSGSLDSDNQWDVVLVTGGAKYEAPTSAVTKAPTSATSPTTTPTSTPTPTP